MAGDFDNSMQALRSAIGSKHVPVDRSSLRTIESQPHERGNVAIHPSDPEMYAALQTSIA